MVTTYQWAHYASRSCCILLARAYIGSRRSQDSSANAAVPEISSTKEHIRTTNVTALQLAWVAPCWMGIALSPAAGRASLPAQARQPAHPRHPAHQRHPAPPGAQQPAIATGAVPQPRRSQHALRRPQQPAGHSEPAQQLAPHREWPSDRTRRWLDVDTVRALGPQTDCDGTDGKPKPSSCLTC